MKRDGNYYDLSGLQPSYDQAPAGLFYLMVVVVLFVLAICFCNLFGQFTQVSPKDQQVPAINLLHPER